VDGDPFELDRFAAAQERDGTFARAVHELRAGAKRSHWMWFVFPQLAGLGHSEMSRRYAIASLAEARAYLAHPLLGPRLIECAEILLGLETHDAEMVLGPVDGVKLRSSMTLFARAGTPGSVFGAVLDAYFGGEGDVQTDRLLDTRQAGGGAT
jgi:uncharacterized protein (DUF1810 family)